MLTNLKNYFLVINDDDINSEKYKKCQAEIDKIQIIVSIKYYILLKHHYILLYKN